MSLTYEPEGRMGSHIMVSIDIVPCLALAILFCDISIYTVNRPHIVTLFSIINGSDRITGVVLV